MHYIGLTPMISN